MTKATTLNLLVDPAPDDHVARATLVAMRRLVIGGIGDASAANLLLATFGLGYRRPLMFLRVMMTELSRVSQRPIAIAPCCCPRMTEGEGAILLAIDVARDHPDVARAALARVTATLDVLPALSVAQAFAASLDDLGRPISL